METSLQSVHLPANELSDTLASEQAVEGEHHIHLPNPSLWPFILSMAILVTMIGLLYLPTNPWLSVAGAPFVLIGILGWALEDPMKTADNATVKPYRYYPQISQQDVLERAEAIVDRTVTVSSTAYSTHPVKVEIDQVKDNGIILALYGKVELEAQRQRVEEDVRRLPNVLEVRNFIVAEDEILNTAYTRLENLRSQGKLDDAQNILILVENYILNLYGNVPTTDMRMMLEREMIGIPGVRVVVNHIGLNEDIPGNLGRTRNKI